MNIHNQTYNTILTYLPLALYNNKMAADSTTALTLNSQMKIEWQKYYLNFISKYFTNPLFDWNRFTGNMNINPQFIFDNPQYPWALNMFCLRTDIPIKTIITHYHNTPNFELALRYLIERKDMTVKFIEEHLDYPWPFNYMHMFRNVTIDFIKKYESKADTIYWHNLIYNEAYTPKEFIMAFPDHIDEPTIKYTTGYTSAQLVELDNTVVNVLCSQRTFMNIEQMVEKYPMQHWNWMEISINPNLSDSFIKKYAKLLNWKFLTISVTKSIICENPTLPWDYGMYYKRTDISREELMSHILDYGDCTSDVGAHPEIRFRDFNNGIIKFNMYSLCSNTFAGEKRDFIARRFAGELSTTSI